MIFEQASVLGFPEYVFPAAASEQTLAALEQLIDHELPASLRNMYLRHDGEVTQHGRRSPGLFLGLEFLSIAQAMKIREGFVAGLHADQEFDELNRYYSRPPATVQEVYYSAGWLPFAGLYTADEIGLDFAPAPAGAVGQVILFRRDVEDRIRLAGSFDEFVSKVQDAYARRRLHPAFGHRLGQILDSDFSEL